MEEGREGRVNGRSAQKRLLKEIESSLQHRFVDLCEFIIKRDLSSFTLSTYELTCVQRDENSNYQTLYFRDVDRLLRRDLKRLPIELHWADEDRGKSRKKNENEISDGFSCSRRVN